VGEQEKSVGRRKEGQLEEEEKKKKKKKKEKEKYPK
jgi:hypothetical protein